MKLEQISNKIQSIFRISKYEMTAVAIIILGAIIAIPSGYFYKSVDADANLIDFNTTQLIDQIATNNRTAYVGSNAEGLADTNLTPGDTIIPKESKFPTATKKILAVSDLISLNNASKAELMKIPNVGDATANKIIDYRTKNKFKSINEIMNIKGIGEKKFEKMKSILKL